MQVSQNQFSFDSLRRQGGVQYHYIFRPFPLSVWLCAPGLLFCAATPPSTMQRLWKINTYLLFVNVNIFCVKTLSAPSVAAGTTSLLPSRMAAILNVDFCMEFKLTVLFVSGIEMVSRFSAVVSGLSVISDVITWSFPNLRIRFSSVWNSKDCLQGFCSMILQRTRDPRSLKWYVCKLAIRIFYEKPRIWATNEGFLAACLAYAIPWLKQTLGLQQHQKSGAGGKLLHIYIILSAIYNFIGYLIKISDRHLQKISSCSFKLHSLHKS